MKVLVTGAAGQVGAAVAREFLEHGHEVRILDIAVPAEDLREKCEVVYCDLQDRPGLMRACDGIDGIAHLAAIPNPTNGHDKVLFGPNVLGTQILLDVADQFGIKRFALASSFSIYGFAFQKGNWGEIRENPLEPQYLPMDVAHPIVSEDVYALSKQCNEITAAMYTRRSGMATVCMRLSMVIDLERSHWIQRRWRHMGEHKSRELWSYIDRRDVASAYRLSLENVESGHHVLVITAQDSMVRGPKREAIETYFPNLVPFLEKDFDFETEGFWDTRPAQELLGWKSKFHWRDYIKEDEA